MISKEPFIKYMSDIYDLFKTQEDIDDCCKGHPLLHDCSINILSPVTTMVSLLESHFYTEKFLSTTKETTLSWWIYDREFGKKFKIGDLIDPDLPESDSYHKPDLSTLPKLYDYLVYESKTLSTTE